MRVEELIAILQTYEPTMEVVLEIIEDETSQFGYVNDVATLGNSVYIVYDADIEN